MSPLRKKKKKHPLNSYCAGKTDPKWNAVTSVLFPPGSRIVLRRKHGNVTSATARQKYGECWRRKVGYLAGETSRQRPADSEEAGIYLYDPGSGHFNMFFFLF